MHSPAPRSVRQQHQHGPAEPRGNRLDVNKLVHKVATWVASAVATAVARRVELWNDIHVVPPALAAAPSCWRSATSCWFCQTSSPSGSRRAVATWRLCTCCRAPRPRCARSRSGWPTPPRERGAQPRAARARCDGPRACWRAKARIGWIARAQPRALARDVTTRGLLTTKQIACCKSVSDEDSGTNGNAFSKPQTSFLVTATPSINDQLFPVSSRCNLSSSEKIYPSLTMLISISFYPVACKEPPVDTPFPHYADRGASSSHLP